MNRAAAILGYADAITEAMVKRYENVVKCGGRIQYRIYVWEYGKVECMEQPQGGNGYLASMSDERLFYVTTVGGQRIDPWDFADHSKPDDPAEAEAEEAEIIDWLVDEYRQTVRDTLEEIAEEAEREDRDD